MVDLPPPLRLALEAELQGHSNRELGPAADRLSQRYRADHPAAQPILASALDTAAYLATRMPATYAAARQVFDRLAAVRPDFRPRTLLDVGVGTGACTWAASDAFPTLESVRLVDSSAQALAAGQRLLAGSDLTITPTAARADRPEAWAGAGRVDLAVCGFLLGELTDADRASVISEMARTASVVAVIEAGTPAGYRRVLDARAGLLAAGLSLLAPCPHDDDCPLAPTHDWCHFAVRLTRSIRHRQIKGAAERGYEDEKYSYVVAADAVGSDAVGSDVAAADQPAQNRQARILRHPQIRTGHVRLTLCDTEPAVRDVTVSKRHGPDYRAARHAAWGDPWPPPDVS